MGFLVLVSLYWRIYWLISEEFWALFNWLGQLAAKLNQLNTSLTRLGPQLDQLKTSLARLGDQIKQVFL